MAPRRSERACRVLAQQQGIDEARRFAQLAVTNCSAACQVAAEMVVTELADNIVKYGAKGQGPFAGTIAIGIEEGTLRISASNEVAHAREARAVTDAIAEIAGATDVKVIYRARLELLLKNPGLARAQLGLLRVVCEGAFRLSCKYEPPTLTVTAQRTFDNL